MSEPEVEIPFTIVVLGKTGTGKSSTANSILGRDAFVAARSLSGVTASCKRELSADGSLAIVDTPGLHEEGRSEAEIWSEIERSVQVAGVGGISAILLVLSLATRITSDDVEALESLGSIFGPTMLERSTIVWTHAAGVVSLEDFCQAGPARLQAFLSSAGGGSVMIENDANALGLSGFGRGVEDVLSRARATRAAVGSAYTADLLEEARCEHAIRKKLKLATLGRLSRKQARRVRQLMTRFQRKSRPTVRVRETWLAWLRRMLDCWSSTNVATYSAVARKDDEDIL